MLIPTRVLVIDDEPDVLETLKSVLESRGFVVDTATKEEQISNCIGEFKPNVILLDINLKHSHGGEICRNLKKTGLAKNISVVLFSGDRTLKEEYKNYEADNFIEKPVRINDLVSILKQSSLRILSQS